MVFHLSPSVEIQGYVIVLLNVQSFGPYTFFVPYISDFIPSHLLLSPLVHKINTACIMLSYFYYRASLFHSFSLTAYPVQGLSVGSWRIFEDQWTKAGYRLLVQG